MSGILPVVYIIPQKLILLPLLCRILATIIIITTYPQSKIRKRKGGVIIKNFTRNAWNFNTFYNNIIAEKIINIAYRQSYKNTDKGLIEEIINNTAIKKIITAKSCAK